MGKSSQRKGRAGERELAEVLRGYGFNVRVGEAMNYGMEADVVGLPGVHCEVKRCEQLRLSEWMEQAIRDARRFRDGVPIIFHRRSREKWRVTMSLDDFMEVYQRAIMGGFERK